MTNKHPGICRDCAIKAGGKWPDGHVATFWAGVCKYCGKEKPCCAETDWQLGNLTKLQLLEKLGLDGCLTNSEITSQNYKEKLYGK